MVPIDSVATVKAEYLDTGMTVVVGLGILVVVATNFLWLFSESVGPADN
jgi:hypothetical protein